LLGIALPLRAEISERDFLAPGDGLLTYDDVHGREWLDLTETLGFDRTTIIEATQPGGSLDSFSLAELEDIEELVASANLSWIEPWSLPGVTGTGPKSLVDLVGEIIQMEGVLLLVRLSSGQISDGPASASHLPVFIGTRAYVLSVEAESLQPGGLNRPIYPMLNHGGVFTAPTSALENEQGGPFWLYRAAIPEPSSLMLLLLGISIWSMRPAKGR
jgi:hypothetical protein